MRRQTVEFWQAKDGWRWRCRSANGKLVAESGEGYLTKAGAKSGLLSFMRRLLLPCKTKYVTV